MTNSHTILLVDNRPQEAMLIQALLRENNWFFSIRHVNHYFEAISFLTNEPITLMILALHHANDHDIENIHYLHERFPHIPLIVLTDQIDPALAIQAIRKGAQDVLCSHFLDPDQLSLALHCTLERHRRQYELCQMALMDELTSLYNRRGFLHLGERHLRLAQRDHQNMLLFYIDLDDLKQINDKFGHAEGDRALLETGRLLQSTFRTSDIIARIGGDEFTVLALNADTDADVAMLMQQRLSLNLLHFNQQERLPYRLSFSIGVTTYVPEQKVTIDKLLSVADEKMYAVKRTKHNYGA
ncbi:GGDEF domain-containing protein [Heliophilum fasciatum]|uniref:Stage 0 sporulation protein A homolog n=1 Tax=Heliophilum fasciatum TaxID=35700 RepID=A0A4R2RHA6_9FIRM|nr:diguanylate cyclase response regulator [Heliophilum fasciatum]MCW2279042.1 diguanylate cyclase (GGDEF)-like protein [Heliophilum fasciatum]TCP61507.1 diguanylate cyclase (GGDEF)-like protein [Heliophilum fasciatum]